MCAVKRTHTLVTTAAGLALGLLTVGSVQAQTAVTTLAQRHLPVIPLHHHYLWTFNVDNALNPTTGHYAAIRLNDSGSDLPETLQLPSFIDPGPTGIVLTPQAGIATGTVKSRKLGDDWTSYSFAVQIHRAFTRIWDVARKTEVAEGYSGASFQVSYDLFNPKFPVDPLANLDPYYYSVLGPKAHESDIRSLGFSIRNFNLVMHVVGAGRTILPAGQQAEWQISNTFLSARGIAVGTFDVTPRGEGDEQGEKRRDDDGHPESGEE